MQGLEGDRVECHSGFRYGVRPQAFYIQGEGHIVDKVKSEARTSRGLFFTVSTSDGQIYNLTYDESRDSWEIRGD